MKKSLKYKCLIVDDEKTFTYYLKKVLEVYGFEVFDFNSAKKALKTLENTEVDIILTDIDMPEMDGFEFLSVLKNDTKTKDIPVLIVSNNNNPAHLNAALELDAIGFIKKSVLKFHMEQIIKHIMESKTIMNN